MLCSRILRISMQDYSGKYSQIYDLVTQHKDYCLEVQKIEELLGRLGLNELDAKVALSVGCGTGNHETLLVERNTGLKLDAIDISPGMIKVAKKKIVSKSLEGLNFHCIDIKDLAKNKFYDFSISLFNVVNCLSDTLQLENFLHKYLDVLPIMDISFSRHGMHRSVLKVHQLSLSANILMKLLVTSYAGWRLQTFMVIN